MFITCYKTNFAYQNTFVHYLKSTRNTIPKTAILFHHSRTEIIFPAIWPTISNRYPRYKVAQWLRCCTTNRKVAGSIPAGVAGIFIDIKSFRSHYGLGVDSASNRNEYQEHFLGVKATGPVPLSWNLGTLTSWNPLGHSRPVTGLLYLTPLWNFKTALYNAAVLINKVCRGIVKV